MRLTLRTLLAYLDDILEPEDHAELGKKIEESEFASELVHRTRDVMRRMRLGAPQVSGRGMGLDPNTVADYLDNTLPAERVAEFEKVCLESDVHLAEAAACHQILTLVLGEPAHVEPSSRERMYHVPQLAEQLARQPAAVPDASPEKTAAVASTESRSRKKPEVPDYLRESERSKWKSLAAGILIVVAIAAAALVIADPLHFFQPAAEDHAAVAHGEKELPDGPPADKAPRPAASETPVPSEASPHSVDEPQDAVKEVPPEASVAKVPGEPTTTPPAELPPAPGDDPDLPPLPKERPPAEEPNPDVANVKPVPGQAAEPELPHEKPSPEPTATDPVVVNPRDPAAETGEESSKPIGVYSAGKNVLLRKSSQTGDWHRLSPRTALHPGDQLLALPTFRPAVTLGGVVTLEMAGGTSVVLEGMDADGIPGIQVLYGRVVLVGVGKPGGQIRLGMGGKTYLATFGDVDSTLAMKLSREHPFGADPEAGPAPVTVDLFASRGSLDWSNGETVEVRAPVHWRLAGPDGQVQQVSDQLPDWIDLEELSLSDRRASMTLEEAFTDARPVSLTLRELVDQRRLEVRSLVARCAMHLGQFEPFVAALGDPDQHARWNSHIEAIREAMALDPQIAAKVREAFARRSGENGEVLYRMMWGYSKDDLDQGAGEQLINYLDHDDLAFRVLAFWNLKTLTGLGLNYQPEYNKTKRRAAVQSWRDRGVELKEPLPTSKTPATAEVPSEVPDTSPLLPPGANE